MALLMNDDVVGAEAALEGGHSSFHKVKPLKYLVYYEIGMLTYSLSVL